MFPSPETRTVVSASKTRQGESAETSPAASQPVTEAKAVAAVSAAETAREVASEEVAETVEEVNDFLGQGATSLKFSVDEDSGGRIIVSVVDADTGEILRQIPPEEIMRVARGLQEVSSGLIEDAF